jgi:hypothetical protein
MINLLREYRTLICKPKYQLNTVELGGAIPCKKFDCV